MIVALAISCAFAQVFAANRQGLGQLLLGWLIVFTPRYGITKTGMSSPIPENIVLRYIPLTKAA